MKSNKIKALLKIKDKKNDECYKYLGLSSNQSLSMKYTRESFSSDDLIKIAELTDTTLAFIDNKTNDVVVRFDINDINKNLTKK